MRRVVRGFLSIAVRNRACQRFLEKIVVRTARYIEEQSQRSSSAVDPDGSLFERFADYTRLPKDIFDKNLRLVSEFRDVRGCVVECGVWRGGMSAGMACVLGKQRDYYLFDSFEGLPEATEVDGRKALDWQHNDADNCRTDESFAHKAMKIAGAERYHVIKGWFNHTLPEFRPDERIAVLRLDADWYSSTAECLNNLYEQVVPNGVIIIDDYYAWDGCCRAVHDFLSHNRLADRIKQYECSVCYLVKSEDVSVTAIDPTADKTTRES